MPVHDTAAPGSPRRTSSFRSPVPEPLLEIYRTRPESFAPITAARGERRSSPRMRTSRFPHNVNWPSVSRSPARRVRVAVRSLQLHHRARFGARTTAPGSSGTNRDVGAATCARTSFSFHAVFWPAFLLSAGCPFRTFWRRWCCALKNMSKSVGNVVAGRHRADSTGALGTSSCASGLRQTPASLTMLSLLQRDLATTSSHRVARRSPSGSRSGPRARDCEDN